MNAYFRQPSSLYHELSRLQRHFDQLFSPGSPSGIRELAGAGFPAINLGSTPDSVEILAMAPGLDMSAVEITVEKGLLVIAGQRAAQAPSEGSRTSVYANERFSGPFRRVISLPEDADPTKVEANYRDGLLRITVAKRESSKPRRIDVQ